MSIWKVALSCGEVDAGTTSRLLYQRPLRKLASWRPVFETNHLFRCCRVGLVWEGSLQRWLLHQAALPLRRLKGLQLMKSRKGVTKAYASNVDEKFRLGHKCKRLFLHWRVLALGRYAVDDEVAETHMDTYVDEATLEISLHTISRAHVPTNNVCQGNYGPTSDDGLGGLW